VWAYQVSPHDLHDYDAVNEGLVIDAPWKGRVRKALLRPERNGYVYLHDRATGEVLAAEPFVLITTTRGVDLTKAPLPGGFPQL
jgi:glucose dehydrogenase